MKKFKKNSFTAGLVLSVILGVAFSFAPQESSAIDELMFFKNRIPCNSNAMSTQKYFYVDCSGCVRVYGSATGGDGKCNPH